MSEPQLYLSLGNTCARLALWTPAEGWVAQVCVGAVSPEGALAELVQGLATEGHDFEAGNVLPVVSSRGDLEAWRAAFRSALGVELAVMGADFTASLRTAYRDPAQLGQDRVANAVAALAEEAYPCLILDAGTCLTADVLDEDGVHQGGAIAPGATALLLGLTSAAPHLQRFLEHEVAPEPDQPWGLSTEENLSLGWVESLGGIGQALVERYEQMTECPGEVILTGGDAETVNDHLAVPGLVRPWLTLDGLRLTWEKRRGA